MRNLGLLDVFSRWPSKKVSSVCYCRNEEHYKSFTECFCQNVDLLFVLHNRFKKKAQALLSLFFHIFLKNDVLKFFLWENSVSMTLSTKLNFKNLLTVSSVNAGRKSTKNHLLSVWWQWLLTLCVRQSLKRSIGPCFVPSFTFPWKMMFSSLSCEKHWFLGHFSS